MLQKIFQHFCKDFGIYDFNLKEEKLISIVVEYDLIFTCIIKCIFCFKMFLEIKEWIENYTSSLYENKYSASNIKKSYGKHSFNMSRSIITYIDNKQRKKCQSLHLTIKKAQNVYPINIRSLLIIYKEKSHV